MSSFPELNEDGQLSKEEPRKLQKEREHADNNIERLKKNVHKIKQWITSLTDTVNPNNTVESQEKPNHINNEVGLQEIQNGINDAVKLQEKLNHIFDINLDFSTPEEIEGFISTLDETDKFFLDVFEEKLTFLQEDIKILQEFSSKLTTFKVNETIKEISISLNKLTKEGSMFESSTFKESLNDYLRLENFKEEERQDIEKKQEEIKMLEDNISSKKRYGSYYIKSLSDNLLSEIKLLGVIKQSSTKRVYDIKCIEISAKKIKQSLEFMITQAGMSRDEKERHEIFQEANKVTESCRELFNNKTLFVFLENEIKEQKNKLDSAFNISLDYKKDTKSNRPTLEFHKLRKREEQIKRFNEVSKNLVRFSKKVQINLQVALIIGVLFDIEEKEKNFFETRLQKNLKNKLNILLDRAECQDCKKFLTDNLKKYNGFFDKKSLALINEALNDSKWLDQKLKKDDNSVALKQKLR